jgi:hypothetical protein
MTVYTATREPKGKRFLHVVRNSAGDVIGRRMSERTYQFAVISHAGTYVARYTNSPRKYERTVVIREAE